MSFYGMELGLLCAEYSTWARRRFSKGEFEVPGFVIVDEVEDFWMSCILDIAGGDVERWQSGFVAMDMLSEDFSHCF